MDRQTTHHHPDSKTNPNSLQWTALIHARFRLGRHAGSLLLWLLLAVVPTAFADQSVTLAWDPNPEPDVSGYLVYFGNASRDYPWHTNVGNVTTATVYGLQEGLTYYFAITATNTAGLESDYSNEVTNSIPSDLTNSVPQISPLTDQVIAENGATPAIAFQVSDAETPAANLVVSASSTNTVLVPVSQIDLGGNGATRRVTVRPANDQLGTTLITLTVSDGSKASSTSFLVQVTPVDGPPTLDPLGDLVLSEDAGMQEVVLHGISGSPAKKAVTVTAQSSAPALIPNPTVSDTNQNGSRTLQFTPQPNASGSAIITVTVSDKDVPARVATQFFAVKVIPVNDPPTLDALSNVTLDENAPMQTISLTGITSGAPGETQTLSVTATSDNTGLIVNPAVTYTSPNKVGILSFTPNQNASGKAFITVVVNDHGGLNNIVTRTFQVTVNAADEPPTLDPLNDLVINEDAPQQTVPLTGIGAGNVSDQPALSVTATSSDPTLIPSPTINYVTPANAGTLTFSPLPNANGSATIIVKVTGGANDTVTQTFVVTVNPVNDPPTLNSISNLILETDAGPQSITLTGISFGAANENQTLTIAAMSSNSALIPHPTVNYTNPGSSGTLSFTPLPNANGTATITVSVNDGGSENNTTSQDFTVTVNAINKPPTLDPINNLTINEDAGPQTIALTGLSGGNSEASPPLTVIATSSNPALIAELTTSYLPANGTGNLLLTPQPDANGTAVITVEASNGTGASHRVARTFSVTINPVNDPPTCDPIPDQVIEADALTHTVNFTGINVGPTNETQYFVLMLTDYTAFSVISTPTLRYNIYGHTAALSFQPTTTQRSFAKVTLAIQDNGGTSNGGQDRSDQSFWLMIVNTPQDRWLAAHFSIADLATPDQESHVWGDDADPDQDGFNNLGEYALGLDPNSPNTFSQAFKYSFVKAGGHVYATLTFKRRKIHPSVEYIPEVSGDLKNWQTGTNHVREVEGSVQDLSAEFEAVTFQDLLPMGGSQPRFMRLRIARNEGFQ